MTHEPTNKAKTPRAPGVMTIIFIFRYEAKKKDPGKADG